MRLTGSGIQTARGGDQPDTAPPELDVHAPEMLRQAGYADEDIATLRLEAAIGHTHFIIRMKISKNYETSVQQIPA